MQTEDFIKHLLDFGYNWPVTKVSFTEGSDFEIEVHVKYKPILGQKIYDHREDRRWRHLNIFQYRCYINCSLPRIIGDDGKVHTLEAPWADKLDRHTYV